MYLICKYRFHRNHDVFVVHRYMIQFRILTNLYSVTYLNLCLTLMSLKFDFRTVNIVQQLQKGGLCEGKV